MSTKKPTSKELLAEAHAKIAIMEAEAVERATAIAEAEAEAEAQAEAQAQAVERATANKLWGMEELTIEHASNRKTLPKFVRTKAQADHQEKHGTYKIKCANPQVKLCSATLAYIADRTYDRGLLQLISTACYTVIEIVESKL